MAVFLFVQINSSNVRFWHKADIQGAAFNNLGEALWYGCVPQFEAPDHEELEEFAMPRFGIPRRDFHEQAKKVMQVNWRRGLLRVWLLLSRRVDYGVGRLFDYLWHTGRVPKFW